jgi:hypothetical protein
MTMQAKYPRYGYKRHGPGGPVLLGAALLLLLASPLALAGPNCDKFPDHPSCAGFTAVEIEARYVYDDGLGLNYEMEEASPWLGPYPNPVEEHHPWYWDGMPDWDDFDENKLVEIPRHCAIGGTGEFPPYICNDPDYRGGRIYIDMSVASNWLSLGKKKDIAEYCDLLNDWSDGTLPTFGGQPLTFGVTWSAFGYDNDTCEEGPGNCPIGTAILSLRPGLNQLTDLSNKTGGLFALPDVDQIKVFGRIGITQGPIVFPVGFPDTESNPFTLPQALPLEKLEIQFVAGSKRAACEAEVTLNTIWLVTEPLE